MKERLIKYTQPSSEIGRYTHFIHNFTDLWKAGLLISCDYSRKCELVALVQTGYCNCSAESCASGYDPFLSWTPQLNPMPHCKKHLAQRLLGQLCNTLTHLWELKKLFSYDISSKTLVSWIHISASYSQSISQPFIGLNKMFRDCTLLEISELPIH